MKKEFLEDYEADEIEEWNKNLNWVLEDGLPPNPILKRLVNPKKPLVKSSGPALESIWAQVPFSGSLVINLLTLPKDRFEEFYHIKIRDISNLIDFIKETGKIQFVLSNKPTEYLGLEYLEPIFTELRPPLRNDLPIEPFLSKKEINELFIRYETIGNVSFFQTIQKHVPRKIYKQFLISSFKHYCFLKVLGCEDLYEEIERLMIDNPILAMELITLTITFITSPFSDTITRARNYSLSDLKRMNILPINRRLSFEEIHFPCEIGKFLIKKLIHYSPTFETCKYLSYIYEDTELIKILESLNQGISNLDKEKIIESKTTLTNLLDEIWEDKSIQKKIDYLKFGIEVSIGAIGTIAGYSIAGSLGLLTSLGFPVVDKLLNFKLNKISEKIIKSYTQNYMVNIYDFKKKHNLK